MSDEEIEPLSKDLQALTEENHSLRKQIETLKQQLNFDPLTNTLSKAGFYEHIAKSAAPGDFLYFLDIDDFKTVNDSYGHPVGDSLLCEIGQALVRNIPPSGRVGRLGGDEFLILIPSAQVSDGLDFANFLCSIVLNASTSVGELSISRSASVGFATIDDELDPEHIVVNSNSALRSAKSSGKNRAKAFAGDLKVARFVAPSIDEVRRGLMRNEFGYYVQPIFDLRSANCIGYEALLRWSRKGGEVLGPAHFLDNMTAVYKQGTKPPLAAAHRIAHWSTVEQGKAIAFNISSAFVTQFIEKGWAWIGEIIGDVPLDMVVFELVETIVDSDNEEMKTAVSRLREKGIRIAIDDFGIGHSTMHRLQMIEVDYVKVDRSFLESASQSERDGGILRGMIELIHASGAEAIIEGIESASQLEMAKSYGASFGQGFFLGRPGPVPAWDVSDSERPILARKQPF